MAVNGSSSTHSARRAGQPGGQRHSGVARPRAGRPARPQIPASPACASASGRRAPSPGWKKRRFSPAPSGDLIPGWCPIHSRLRWKLSKARGAGVRPASTPRRCPRASPVSRRSRVVFPRRCAAGDLALHSPASTENDSPRNSVLSSRSVQRLLLQAFPLINVLSETSFNITHISGSLCAILCGNRYRSVHLFTASIVFSPRRLFARSSPDYP